LKRKTEAVNLYVTLIRCVKRALAMLSRPADGANRLTLCRKDLTLLGVGVEIYASAEWQV